MLFEVDHGACYYFLFAVNYFQHLFVINLVHYVNPHVVLLRGWLILWGVHYFPFLSLQVLYVALPLQWLYRLPARVHGLVDVHLLGARYNIESALKVQLGLRYVQRKFLILQGWLDGVWATVVESPLFLVLNVCFVHLLEDHRLWEDRPGRIHEDSTFFLQDRRLGLYLLGCILGWSFVQFLLGLLSLVVVVLAELPLDI